MTIELGRAESKIINGNFYSIYKVNDDFIWFNVQKEFNYLVSETSDCAAVALLYPAMAAGENIVIDGVISEALLYNISGPLQSALKILNPSLNEIKVTAHNVHRGCHSSGVMSGFSRGVDSFSIVKRHLLESPPRGFRLTHVSLHDIWAEDNVYGLQNPGVLQRYNASLSIVSRWGIPFLLINSNVGSFYKGLRFEDTHTIRNIAAAHFCAGGIGRYIYASGIPLQHQKVARTNDMAWADALIIPMTSSEALNCYPGDAEFTRLQKTIGLADLADAQQFLQVCALSVEHNCSTCWKCMRTLYTLELLGKIELFSHSFNLERYKDQKDAWISEMSAADDVFFRELSDYSMKI